MNIDRYFEILGISIAIEICYSKDKQAYERKTRYGKS